MSLDAGRIADIKELVGLLNGATGMKKRDIERTIQDILNENGYTRSMRETLIREMRQGRHDNVKDIQDQVARNRNILDLG